MHGYAYVTQQGTNYQLPEQHTIVSKQVRAVYNNSSINCAYVGRYKNKKRK